MVRWLIYLGCGLLAVLAFLAVSLLLASPWLPSSLKVENFSKLEPGMSQAEVAQLLGGGPGDYGFHQGGVVSEVQDKEWLPGPELHVLTWFDDQAKLEIAFDADGKVVSKVRHIYLRTPSKLSWRYWWNCYVK
ncbi:MAG TPA: hypothetical protein PKD86_09870 [Gemmatales bacterium]|nr:hypothetical protein [Gemmatales bacterium]HMP59649.1 hypothetical protein [Gemmatales bacterium]